MYPPFLRVRTSVLIFKAPGTELTWPLTAAVNVQENLDTVVLEDNNKACSECVEYTVNTKGKDAQKRLLCIMQV